MKRNCDFLKEAVIRGPVKSKSQVDKVLSEQKMLTSIRLDKEIVEVAKRKAFQEGVGHLTWINKKLRRLILGEDDLEERVKKLEKIVKKKNRLNFQHTYFIELIASLLC